MSEPSPEIVYRARMIEGARIGAGAVGLVCAVIEVGNPLMMFVAAVQAIPPFLHRQDEVFPWREVDKATAKSYSEQDRP